LITGWHWWGMLNIFSAEFQMDLGFRYQDVSLHFFKLNNVIFQWDLH